MKLQTDIKSADAVIIRIPDFNPKIEGLQVSLLWKQYFPPKRRLLPTGLHGL
jgi:hypothetical protein